MLDPRQLANLVVRPTFESIGLYSRDAVALLMGTAMQESQLTYLRQLENGPALGLWQMEPTTHDDIWANYLRYRWRIAQPIKALVPTPGPRAMVDNLSYACAMARVHYLRVPEPLPGWDDVHGQALYWKKHYNTFLGKGTPGEFILNYERLLREGWRP